MRYRNWTPGLHFAPAGGCSAARLFSTDADSHDDFKPQVKAAPAGDVEATIEKDISSHDVFIYMKVRGAPGR